MSEQTGQVLGFILWYHSESHGKDRFYTGQGKVQVFVFTADKPTWTYNKDEAHIFESMGEAQAAKEFCETCKYKNLYIQPLDAPPVWAPPEVVHVTH